MSESDSIRSDGVLPIKSGFVDKNAEMDGSRNASQDNKLLSKAYLRARRRS